jgi:zinc D-Ala-D-Ala carboxypeptidase
MQLSKHFTLSEMEKSQTAVRKGISNKAGSGEIKNLTDLCYEVLEPVRIKFDKPVIITSGYRSPELCEAIGSKATSQHAKGQAVDFEIAGISNLQVALWIQNNCDFDQLILEFWKEEDKDPNSGWVHCSYVDGSNRKQVLTFDGKTYTNGLPEAKWRDGKLSN